MSAGPHPQRTRSLIERGGLPRVGVYTAYDGLADVATLTSGRVHALDLTIDSQARATCTRNSARHMNMHTQHAHTQAHAQAHARHMHTAYAHGACGARAYAGSHTHVRGCLSALGLGLGLPEPEP